MTPKEIILQRLIVRRYKLKEMRKKYSKAKTVSGKWNLTEKMHDLSVCISELEFILNSINENKI
jgi:hypothetical protein